MLSDDRGTKRHRRGRGDLPHDLSGFGASEAGWHHLDRIATRGLCQPAACSRVDLPLAGKDGILRRSPRHREDDTSTPRGPGGIPAGAASLRVAGVSRAIAGGRIVGLPAVGPQRSGGGLLPERSGPPGSPQKQGLREERGVASQCQGKPSQAREMPSRALVITKSNAESVTVHGDHCLRIPWSPCLPPDSFGGRLRSRYRENLQRAVKRTIIGKSTAGSGTAERVMVPFVPEP